MTTANKYIYLTIAMVYGYGTVPILNAGHGEPRWQTRT